MENSSTPLSAPPADLTALSPMELEHLLTLFTLVHNQVHPKQIKASLRRAAEGGSDPAKLYGMVLKTVDKNSPHEWAPKAEDVLPLDLLPEPTTQK